VSGGRGSDKEPGEFRRTRPGNARFVPTPPHEIESCMAALAHVQFEPIQPFLDGNGCLGRPLVAPLLPRCSPGQPLLYLSLYFEKNRPVYFGLLEGVRSRGDWQAWEAFFLEGVEATAFGAVETARRLVGHPARPAPAAASSTPCAFSPPCAGVRSSVCPDSARTPR
jgi:hypothetical protein